MRGYIALLLFMSCMSVVAQQKKYYNAQGEFVKKKKAEYYKVVSKTEDDLWKAEQFYMSGTPKSVVYSKKKSGDDKVGTHLSYDRFGTLRKKTTYSNGKLSLIESFYKSSKLESKTVYIKKSRTTTTYYESGQRESEVQYNPIKKGSAKQTQILAKGYYKNGDLKQEDTYVQINKGGTLKLVSGVLFDEQGNEIKHIPFMSSPHFPGGLKMLYRFLNQNIEYPERAKKNKIQGKAIVGFVVNKTAKLENIRITKSSKDFLLDKEAMRLIRAMPSWAPGTYNGKKVKVPYIIPINFKLRRDTEIN